MNIVENISRKYQRRKSFALLLLIASLAVLSVSIPTLFFDLSYFTLIGIGSVTFLTGSLITWIYGGFETPSKSEIVRYLNRTYPFFEESSSLLVTTPTNLLETWQKQRVEEILDQHKGEIYPPNSVLKQSVLGSISILLVSLIIVLLPSFDFNQEIMPDQESSLEEVVVRSNDIPGLNQGAIIIEPPSYTGASKLEIELGNIEAPEGSMIRWKMDASDEVDEVRVLFSDRETATLDKNGNQFEGSLEAWNNHIYQFELTNNDTTVQTEFYGMSIRGDQPPDFTFSEPQDHRLRISSNEPSIDVNVEVTDDYGVTNISLQGTLARGSGESVRFTDQSLSFDNVEGMGTRSVMASANFHADSLEMEPGDELYFYVEATDNRPDPQTSRSETYFIVYSDTTQTEQDPFGSIVVDLLPEYFRSQRQIIIDTEELLDDQPSISQNRFNERSQVIGRDQNLLRVRYGAYLGQDDESGGGDPGEMENVSGDDHSESHDHAAGENQDEEDLNEQGLQDAQSEMTQNVPDAFFHDHGSAEMNTLYAESPRAMLQQALAHMWNAELFLRTNRPDEALPHEYEALELLKQVQQADRQYLRKSGSDLLPIPEDEKRLTGEYDDFSFPENQSTANLELNPLVRLQTIIKEDDLRDENSLQIAEYFINDAEISDSDRIYLLNRLREIATDGVTDGLKQQLLTRLSDLTEAVKRDPAPLRRPALQFDKERE
ncbi:MAG: hypothetical protein WEA58_01905 [Balneolaceae bacterium]